MILFKCDGFQVIWEAMSEFLCHHDVKLVPHTRRLNLHVVLWIERASAPKVVNGGGGACSSPPDREDHPGLDAESSEEK